MKKVFVFFVLFLILLTSNDVFGQKETKGPSNLVGTWTGSMWSVDADGYVLTNLKANVTEQQENLFVGDLDGRYTVGAISGGNMYMINN